MILLLYLISFYVSLKVAIVLLAVVAAVAAESYGYDKSYKPAAYAAPAYSKPAYKEEYAYVRKCLFKNKYFNVVLIYLML